MEPRHVRSVDVEDSSGLKPPTAVAIQLMVDADATPGGVCGETSKRSRGESGVWAAAGAGPRQWTSGSGFTSRATRAATAAATTVKRKRTS